jgi:acyl-CoA dehydrogenase
MAQDPIDYATLDAGRHCNYWSYDPTIRFEARRTYPDDEFAWAEEVLADYGEFVGHTLADNADIVDRHSPQLHTYDDRGEVTNEVEYHPAQFETERRTYADFRLTHDAFHAPPDRAEPVGLLHPLTMQALVCFADVGFACAASMTTGAAVVLEKFAGGDATLTDAFERLTSDDYDDHVEGAMFLTEKQGGSDVGANETRAEPREDGTYELHGEKWFCSNIDAQGALALARTPNAPDGTAGLSLFLVPRELPDGSLNDSRFRRLKDKLGTLSVPTGEIEFDGATAYLVGEEESGFRYMTEMLNYERVTNATGAVGVMGRALLEAKVHAASREAFGSTIQEYPLLRRDLCESTVEYEAAAAVAFEAARQYDRRERAWDTEDEGEREGDEQAYRLMRLFVPVAKYKTADVCVDVVADAMEIRGGDGYVAEQVTERLFRDAQVLPIWEGTANVLSLDVLRALERVDAHEALVPFVSERLDSVTHPLLAGSVDMVEARFEELQTALVTLATEDEDYAQYHAKRLADLIYDVVAGAVLLEEAQWAIDERDDARKALVAGWFVDSRFDDGDAYGITGGSQLGDEYFDVIARYGSVAPGEVGGS